jgi:drug/metabolite transporter (DMT)-like permease
LIDLRSDAKLFTFTKSGYLLFIVFIAGFQMLLLLLLQFLSATAFILFKKTLLFGPPFFLVALRMIIAAVPLLLTALIYDKQSFKKLTSTKTLCLLVGASIFNVYMANAYGLWGMQYVSAGTTSLIYNFSPFISALLGWIILQERMSRLKWLGLCIGFLALLPLICSVSLDCSAVPQDTILAKAAILISAAAAALGWILIKKIAYHYQVSNILINAITISIGGLLSLLHAQIFETIPPITASLLYYSLMAGLVSPLACYLLYTRLLKYYSATLLLFSGFITTFFTAVLGYIFLNEEINSTQIISAIMVFIGLYIFYYADVSEKSIC